MGKVIKKAIQIIDDRSMDEFYKAHPHLKKQKNKNRR